MTTGTPGQEVVLGGAVPEPVLPAQHPVLECNIIRLGPKVKTHETIKFPRPQEIW